MGRWNFEREAEAVLQEDIAEKKRTAQSARKRVTHGGPVRTPADVLQGWEKRRYKQNGSVKRSMVMPESYQDFKILPPDVQKNMIQYVLEHGKESPEWKRELCKKWSVAPGLFTILGQGMGIVPKSEPKPPKEKKNKEQYPEPTAAIIEATAARQQVSSGHDVAIANEALFARLDKLEDMLHNILVEVSKPQARIATKASDTDATAAFMAKIMQNMGRS